MSDIFDQLASQASPQSPTQQQQAQQATAPSAQSAKPVDIFQHLAENNGQLPQPTSVNQPSTPSKSGFVRGAENMLHMPVDLYHMVMDDPRDEEEQRIHDQGYKPGIDPHTGLELPPTAGGLSGQAALILKRLALDPAKAARAKGQQYEEMAKTEPNPKIKKQLLDAAAGYELASKVPLLGPMTVGPMSTLAYGSEENGTGPSKLDAHGNGGWLNTNEDISGLTELLTYVAAPEVLGKAGGAVKSAVKTGLDAADIHPSSINIGGTEVPVRASVNADGLNKTIANVAESVVSPSKLERFNMEQTQPAATKVVSDLDEFIKARAGEAKALADKYQTQLDHNGLEKAKKIPVVGRFIQTADDLLTNKDYVTNQQQAIDMLRATQAKFESLSKQLNTTLKPPSAEYADNAAVPKNVVDAAPFKNFVNDLSIKGEYVAPDAEDALRKVNGLNDLHNALTKHDMELVEILANKPGADGVAIRKFLKTLPQNEGLNVDIIGDKLDHEINIADSELRSKVSPAWSMQLPESSFKALQQLANVLEKADDLHQLKPIEKFVRGKLGQGIVLGGAGVLSGHPLAGLVGVGLNLGADSILGKLLTSPKASGVVSGILSSAIKNGAQWNKMSSDLQKHTIKNIADRIVDAVNTIKKDGAIGTIKNLHNDESGALTIPSAGDWFKSVKTDPGTFANTQPNRPEAPAPTVKGSGPMEGITSLKPGDQVALNATELRNGSITPQRIVTLANDRAQAFKDIGSNPNNITHVWRNGKWTKVLPERAQVDTQRPQVPGATRLPPVHMPTTLWQRIKAMADEEEPKTK